MRDGKVNVSIEELSYFNFNSYLHEANSIPVLISTGTRKGLVSRDLCILSKPRDSSFVML